MEEWASDRDALLGLWIQFTILRLGGISRSSRTVKQQVYEACGFPRTAACIDVLVNSPRISRDQMMKDHHAEEALAGNVGDAEFDDIFSGMEAEGSIIVRRDATDNILSVETRVEVA